MNTPKDMEFKPRRKNISPIWIFPIIALIIGGWLLIKAHNEAGIKVQITFDDGNGIVANKTKVNYRGLEIGEVETVTLTKNLKAVDVTIKFDKSAEELLKANSEFWLVKPEVSLAGISGLETILSGNYIGIKPGDGRPTRNFKALSESPSTTASLPGLHLKLITPTLGSLHQGAPIYYKRIQIGEVSQYNLTEKEDQIIVDIYIKPEYEHLIHKNSRFWNASGISIKGGIGGLDIQTESLVSVLTGGISVMTPETSSKQQLAENKDIFHLFKDFDAAKAGTPIKIEFNSGKGLQPGQTQVLYEGLTIGTVQDVQFLPELNGVIATVNMDPQVDKFLIEGTEFWLVEPKLSLVGASSLANFIRGAHIGVTLATPDTQADNIEYHLNKNQVNNNQINNTIDVKKTKYIALEQKPQINNPDDGMPIILTSKSLNGLDIGSPIYFRDVPVGYVSNFELNKTDKSIKINATIKHNYSELITTESQFWNISGLDIQAGITGINVELNNLSSLVFGGIAFDNNPKNQGKAVKPGHTYTLHDSKEQTSHYTVPINLEFENIRSLKPNMTIKYKGFDVGKITELDLNKNLQGLSAKGYLVEQAKELANSNYKVWLIKPKFKLSGDESLSNLIEGQYLEFHQVKQSGVPQRDFKVKIDTPPPIAEPTHGLNIGLITERLGSITLGMPVYYRDVQVGTVFDSKLAPNADSIYIFINIDPYYAPLVRTNSVFWNRSGIDVNFGLFSGATIKTGTINSILTGGIEFATPNNEKMGPYADNLTFFPLNKTYKDEWLTWTPKIALENDITIITP